MLTKYHLGKVKKLKTLTADSSLINTEENKIEVYKAIHALKSATAEEDFNTVVPEVKDAISKCIEVSPEDKIFQFLEKSLSEKETIHPLIFELLKIEIDRMKEISKTEETF